MESRGWVAIAKAALLGRRGEGPPRAGPGGRGSAGRRPGGAQTVALENAGFHVARQGKHIVTKFSRRDLLHAGARFGNERGGILRGIGDLQARESVIVDFAPEPESNIGELAATFDVVLGVTPAAD